MKFQELKDIFKNKYTMRMVAGVLCLALTGGSIGLCQMQAGKVVTQVSAVQAGAKKRKN